MLSESMIAVASTSTSTLASGAVMLTINTMISAPVPTTTESKTAKIVQWAVPAGIAGVFGIVIVMSLVGCILRCLADRRAAREWSTQNALLPTTRPQNESVQSFFGVGAAPAAQSVLPMPQALAMSSPAAATALPTISRLPLFPLPPASTHTVSGTSSASASTDSLLRDSRDHQRSDTPPQIYISGPGTNFSTNFSSSRSSSKVSLLPQVVHLESHKQSSSRSYHGSVHASPASSENGSDGSRVGRGRSSTQGSARYYYPDSTRYKTYDGRPGEQGVRRNFGPNGSLRR